MTEPQAVPHPKLPLHAPPARDDEVLVPTRWLLGEVPEYPHYVPR